MPADPPDRGPRPALPLEYARPRRPAPRGDRSGLLALILIVAPAVWAPAVFRAFAAGFGDTPPTPIEAGALTLVAALPAMVGVGFLVKSFERSRGVADNPFGAAAGAILAAAVLVAFLRLFA